MFYICQDNIAGITDGLQPGRPELAISGHVRDFPLCYCIKIGYEVYSTSHSMGITVSLPRVKRTRRESDSLLQLVAPLSTSFELY